MKHLICFLLFPIFLVSSQISLDGNHLSYSGKEMSLTGNVMIDHHLGKIQAQQLLLSPKDPTGTQTLQLLGGVAATLADGGILQSEHALVDLSHSIGTFYASPHQLVEYTQSFPTMMHIKGRELRISLTADPVSAKKELNEILVTKNVAIDHKNEIYAYADQAKYEHQPALLTLWSSEEEKCEVKNNNGDRIQADTISLELNTRRAFCSRSIGSIQNTKIQSASNPIQFSADEISWDQTKEILFLKGNVTIEQETLGKIECDDHIQLHQKLENGKKSLNYIICQGKTQFTYINDQGVHILICDGNLHIDHSRQTAYMESISTEQISLENSLGKMFADKITMNYTQNVSNKLEPHYIKFEGNVKMVRQHHGNTDQEAELLQYALADVVESFPQNKEILLSGYHNKRVLLLDQINQCNISAPKLKIHNGEKIEGVGDVRFSFMESEFDQLKKKFAFDEKWKNK